MSKAKAEKLATIAPIVDAKQDLVQMHKYVESLERGGDRSYPLVATETFVEGMRDSGYKSSATAIDEFIDNSIQARAARIDIFVERVPGREEISSIAIVDDGHGMEPGMIRAAVIWGGTHRAGNRDGFGRFGFGLPSAAVSICRTFEVFSKLSDGSWNSVRIDLDKVVKGALTNGDGLVVSPLPQPAELPAHILTQLGKRVLEHGTVILLEQPDRLTTGFKKAGGFTEKLMEHIGLVYRGTLRTTEIFVDNKRVQAVDPLFLDPGARFYDIENGEKAEASEPLTIEMKTADGKASGNIRLRFSYLPPKFQRDSNGAEHKGRLGIMRDNNAYFVVSRAGRQLDLIWRSNFPKGENKVLQNYDRNWVVELDFDPILDEEFGVTVNKQQVALSERVWAILADRGVPAMIKALWSRGDKERTELERTGKNKEEKVVESEQVAAEAKKFQNKVFKQTIKKEEEAAERVTQDVEKLANETKRSEDEVAKEILEEIAARPFKRLFESLEGAPIYRAERYGSQLRIYINMRHRFYTEVYAAPGTSERTKTGLELLFFALAHAEVDAAGDREIFYRTERGEWSKTLDLYLSTLGKRQPIEERSPETGTEVH